MIFNIIFVAAGIAAIVFFFYIRYLVLFIRIPKRIDKAKALMEKNEKLAMQILNEVLTMDRGNTEANWIIAHYHLRKKWYALALMYLLDIIRYGRYTSAITELDVRELLADIYEMSSNADKALQQYTEIRKKHPLTASQYKKVIRLQTEMGEVRDAKKTIDEAAAAFSLDGEFFFLSAQIEFAEKQYDDAEAHLTEAEQKGYHTPETDLLIGKVNFIHQNYEGAIERFQKLPAEYLESDEIEGFLGQSFYRIKDYAHAEDTLSQIVGRMDQGDTHRAEALYFLGCAREMNGNYDKAIEVWRDIPAYPQDLFLAAKEKVDFYTQVATGEAEKTFIKESFEGFSTACQTLLDQMDYVVQKKPFQDERNAEFICTFKKDNYLFNLHYFSFTRQTAPVSEYFLKEKNFRRIAGKARYLSVIAPWFSGAGKEYAKANDIQIYTLELFRKHGLMK